MLTFDTRCSFPWLSDPRSRKKSPPSFEHLPSLWTLHAPLANALHHIDVCLDLFKGYCDICSDLRTVPISSGPPNLTHESRVDLLQLLHTMSTRLLDDCVNKLLGEGFVDDQRRMSRARRSALRRRIIIEQGADVCPGCVAWKRWHCWSL